MFWRTCRSCKFFLSAIFLIVLVSGCETIREEMQSYETKRDKTAKGAGIGAAAGAGVAILKGKRELDDILAGAAIGGGIGFYMDRQEEKLARIPGTRVERVGDNTLLVRFESDVLFKVDSTAVDARGQATLDQCASSGRV